MTEPQEKVNDQQTLICPNCQTPLKLTDRICPNCGEAVGGMEIPDSYPKPKKNFFNTDQAYRVSRSPTIKWVIGMVIAAIFVVGGLLYLLFTGNLFR